MNQIWIARAEHLPGSYPEQGIVFEFAFPKRDVAHELYARGEREVRQLCWSLNMIPFNDAEFADHCLDRLKEEYAE